MCERGFIRPSLELSLPRCPRLTRIRVPRQVSTRVGWVQEMRKAASTKTRSTLLRPRVQPSFDRGVLADLDTQLMLRVRDGSAEAADLLVRRNFERVARYIGRIVRDPPAVEDLSQEVFLRVLTRADAYEPTARLSTWLYRIATNAAINHVTEAYSRRQTAGRDMASAEVPDPCPESGPDREMNLDELKSRVSRAIGDLPIKQRVALTLFEYEELSYQQIASVLEVSVEAVRCLLTRARTTLRSKLAGLA